MAVWLITVISVFGIGLARLTYSAYSFAAFRVNRLVASHAIEAVIMMLKFDRMHEETTGYDTLDEFPSAAEYEVGGMKIMYSLTDEERRININKATTKILKNLPEMDSDVATEIYTSPQRPFAVKEEMLLIDEIGEDTYAALRDFVTIYGDGKVNVNTASEETLKALGVDRGVVSRIMEFRDGDDGEPDTEDDGVFESAGSIMSALKEATYLSLSEEQNLVSLLSKNLLGVKSNNYRLEADVYAKNKIVESFSVVFGRDETLDKYRIKYWRQH